MLIRVFVTACLVAWFSAPASASHDYSDVFQGKVRQVTRLKSRAGKVSKQRVRLVVTRSLQFHRAGEVGRERTITVTSNARIRVGQRYFFSQRQSGGMGSNGVINNVSWIWHGKTPPPGLRRADEFDTRKIRKGLDRQIKAICAKGRIKGRSNQCLCKVYEARSGGASGPTVKGMGASMQLELASGRKYRAAQARIRKALTPVYGSSAVKDKRDYWVALRRERIVTHNGKAGEQYKILFDETCRSITTMDAAGKVLSIDRASPAVKSLW